LGWWSIGIAANRECRWCHRRSRRVLFRSHGFAQQLTLPFPFFLITMIDAVFRNSPQGESGSPSACIGGWLLSTPRGACSTPDIGDYFR
jgi:hypothetical protein